MSNKQRSAILNLLHMLFLFLFISVALLNKLGIEFIIAAIIAPSIITFLISLCIPVNKKKTRTNKKLKASNISKSTKANKVNKLRSDNEILALPLEELSWEEFEQLCYLFFKTKGYKTEKTKKGADGGIDLIYYNKHHQQNVAVQIKHHIDSGKPVTVKEIRELDSSKKNYKCVLADFMSSTGYTKNALIEADNRHIKCHAVDKIKRWKEEEAKRRKIS